MPLPVPCGAPWIARLARLLCIGALGVAPLACAPRGHTVEPYRSDPVAAARLEAEAERLCEAASRGGQNAVQPTRVFVTDGCSAWPDGEETVSCCVEHDLAYWCGGSAAARRAADERFDRCVVERSGSGFLGGLMWLGVRLGGHPVFPMPYRWGYGYPYRGRYPAPEPVAEPTEHDGVESIDPDLGARIKSFPAGSALRSRPQCPRRSPDSYPCRSAQDS